MSCESSIGTRKSERTDAQRLKLIIQKALHNGFPKEVADNVLGETLHEQIINVLLEEYLYYSFIFRHDFAQSFWGKDKIKFCSQCLSIKKEWTDKCGCQGLAQEEEAWKFRLKEMVLKKEKLKYLERFL